MNSALELTGIDLLIANAILGIDTLWGGDAFHPSGTGRFIADSWFSTAPTPAAYTHPAAERLRRTGGVAAARPDHAAIQSYLDAVDVHDAIRGITGSLPSAPPLRQAYLKGLADCLEVMWDLAMEILGKGEKVPYERCVRASTGMDPEPSNPAGKQELLRELLDRAGYASTGNGSLSAAAESWRAKHGVVREIIPALSSELVAVFDRLTQTNLLPYLPDTFRSVPRANIRFLPIANAWFSGSMNYLGHARKADGSPEYEATYEINDSLQISGPEFQQLVSHEVVPGHVTTFAFLQHLYERQEVDFEATVLTMNTLGASLFEGIANNAILIAHAVTEIDQLPDLDLQIGVLLALLQDDAKNQASYKTWQEGVAQPELALSLERDFLVSKERADKLSGAWGRHPLMGRMYLPAYRAGTEKVAELRRKYPPEQILPALYGCRGLVDLATIAMVL